MVRLALLSHHCLHFHPVSFKLLVLYIWQQKKMNYWKNYTIRNNCIFFVGFSNISIFMHSPSMYIQASRFDSFKTARNHRTVSTKHLEWTLWYKGTIRVENKKSIIFFEKQCPIIESKQTVLNRIQLSNYFNDAVRFSGYILIRNLKDSNYMNSIKSRHSPDEQKKTVFYFIDVLKSLWIFVMR